MGDCHYLEGNVYAAKRMDLVRYLLELSGLGQDRLQVRWVSATEGQQFAEYVTELTGILRELGPLDRDRMELPLAAVSRALMNPDLRWLMGIQRQLTEVENVYHENWTPMLTSTWLRPWPWRNTIGTCSMPPWKPGLRPCGSYRPAPAWASTLFLCV